MQVYLTCATLSDSCTDVCIPRQETGLARAGIQSSARQSFLTGEQHLELHLCTEGTSIRPMEDHVL